MLSNITSKHYENMKRNRRQEQLAEDCHKPAIWQKNWRRIKTWTGQ